MPKLDLEQIEQTNRTGYPVPFDAEVQGRWYRRLGPAGGLTEFGVSHVVLKPGAWSSQRHWHEGEDEFLVMLEGKAVLVEDHGRTVLRVGDCAAFPKGHSNGHHLRNESAADCVFVVVGGGAQTGGAYSDIDMLFTAEGRYTRKTERIITSAASKHTTSCCSSGRQSAERARNEAAAAGGLGDLDRNPGIVHLTGNAEQVGHGELAGVGVVLAVGPS